MVIQRQPHCNSGNGGGRARTAGWVENQISRVGRHEHAAFDHVGVRLDYVGFSPELLMTLAHTLLKANWTVKSLTNIRNLRRIDRRRDSLSWRGDQSKLPVTVFQ